MSPLDVSFKAILAAQRIDVQNKILMDIVEYQAKEISEIRKIISVSNINAMVESANKKHLEEFSTASDEAVKIIGAICDLDPRIREILNESVRK